MQYCIIIMQKSLFRVLVMQLQEMLEKMKDIGFSQAKIAKSVGVNQSTISRIKCGKDTSSRNAEKIKAFCKKHLAKTPSCN